MNISKSEKQSLEKYINLLKNNVPTTAYSKQKDVKINLDDAPVKATAYTLKLEGREKVNLEKTMLEKLSTDSITLNFLASRFKLLHLDNNYSSINSLGDEIAKQIEYLENNSEEAGKSPFKMTVYEYRQSNVRTEIVVEGKQITIDQRKNQNTESLKISFANIKEKEDNILSTVQETEQNEESFNETYVVLIEKEKSTGFLTRFYLSFENEDGKWSVDSVNTRQGTVEENNIQNKSQITLTSNSKVLNLVYQDSIDFNASSDDIKDFNGQVLGVMNDYNKSQLLEIVYNIKKVINDVYTKKAASIGLNVSPIFTME